MLVGVDHIVVAVADPDEAVKRIGSALGVEPGGGGRHDRLGTFNRLLWLGDSFVELIGVFDRGLAAASWLGAPSLRALDRGGGLATWAVATDDMQGDLGRLRSASSSLSNPMPGERRRPDGRIVRWQLATPPRLDPTEPPFLIEHDGTGAEWTPADRASRASGPGRLRGIELDVPDVESTAASTAQALGLEWRRHAGSSTYEIAIGDQFIRLRPGDHPWNAVVYLSLDRVKPSTFELLGCRWAVNA
jgi:Glyoxalase-like domain